MKNVIRSTLAVVGLITVSTWICGCGGSDGTSSTTTAAPATVSTVTGSVVKGPFLKGATVSAYKLKTDGKIGDLLKSSSILDDTGKYKLEIPSTYKGAVVIQAHGNYSDEATGTTSTVLAAQPLKGIVTLGTGATKDVTATVPVQITPFTSLITQNVIKSAETVGLSTDLAELDTNIKTEASSVATQLGLTGIDLLSSKPADPKTNADAGANIQYGLKLAQFSQYLKDQKLTYEKFATDVLQKTTDTTVMNTFSTKLQAATTNLEKNSTFWNSVKLSGVSTAALNAVSSANIQAFNEKQHKAWISIMGKEVSLPTLYVSTGVTLSLSASVMATQGAQLNYQWAVKYGGIPHQTSSEKNLALVTNIATTYNHNGCGNPFSVSLTVSQSGMANVTDTLQVCFVKDLLKESDLKGKTYYRRYVENTSTNANFGKIVDESITLNADGTFVSSYDGGTYRTWRYEYGYGFIQTPSKNESVDLNFGFHGRMDTFLSFISTQTDNYGLLNWYYHPDLARFNSSGGYLSTTKAADIQKLLKGQDFFSVDLKTGTTSTYEISKYLFNSNADSLSFYENLSATSALFTCPLTYEIVYHSISVRTTTCTTRAGSTVETSTINGKSFEISSVSDLGYYWNGNGAFSGNKFFSQEDATAYKSEVDASYKDGNLSNYNTAATTEAVFSATSTSVATQIYLPGTYDICYYQAGVTTCQPYYKMVFTGTNVTETRFSGGSLTRPYTITGNQFTAKHGSELYGIRYTLLNTGKDVNGKTYLDLESEDLANGYINNIRLYKR